MNLIPLLGSWFRKKAVEKLESAVTKYPPLSSYTEEERYEELKSYATKIYHDKGICGPHCDSDVLHYPGDCGYCDKYADTVQMQRRRLKIAYTGETDPLEGWLKCPSEVRRNLEDINKWHGNRPAQLLPPEPPNFNYRTET